MNKNIQDKSDKILLVLRKLKSVAPGWVLSLQGLSHFKVLESFSQLFFGKNKVQVNEIYQLICVKGMSEEDKAKLKLIQYIACPPLKLRLVYLVSNR